MKKTYSTLLFLAIGFLTYAQGPEFTIDFEGTDPLSNLPAGVTSINPDPAKGNVVAFINPDGYRFDALGGPIEQQVTGSLIDRAEFVNTIVTDGGPNNVLQTDYTGHIIINETALGTDSFSLRLNYTVFGHTQSSTDCGLFTIVGNDATDSNWKAARLTSRNGSFTTGLGIAGFSGNFGYGTIMPPNNDVVLTYNATDKFYRIYVNGELKRTSETEQASGEWNTRKVYIGFVGRNSIGNGDSMEHLDSATGEFTAKGVRQDGRTSDLQTRMDNIQVYQRAISDAEVTTLFGGGTLSTNTLTKETFNAYPNPVNDRLYFSSKNVNSVEIYNILGAKISSQLVTDGADMSNFSKGLYVIKLKDASGLELGTIKTVKK